MAKNVNRAEKELNRPPRLERPLLSKDLLSSGSTLLNLACSGKAKGAFYKGKYYHLVGCSDGGKTWLSLTCFAEAAINPAFKDFRFVFDDPENGAGMNMRKFFGDAADRIMPPNGTNESPVFSHTVEEFYYNLHDHLKRGPCIYILDSMDAITSAPDEKKFDALKKQYRKKSAGEKVDKEESGNYGMAKAKANAAGMREAFSLLAWTDSIVIIISQAKALVGFGAMPGEKSFSGGTSLKYYCHAQLWSSPIGQIKKAVGGKARNIGTLCQVRVKKNRHTGRKASAKVIIHWAGGIDDTGSMVDWLLEEKYWSKKDGLINAKEFDLVLKREPLILAIEGEKGLIGQLQDICEGVWEGIVEESIPRRYNKYTGETTGKGADDDEDAAED